MRPMVKPALRRSWRDRTTVQFGIGPDRAVVLEGVDRHTERLLGLLDGTRGTDRLRAEAAGLGVSTERVDGVLGLLREGGVLDDARAATALHRLPHPAWERLRPDAASLSVVHPAPGAAAARLSARRDRGVQVRGAGRVGASVAAVLASAGVGRVEVVDSGPVEPWDVSPCGIRASDIGRRRGAAARAAVRAAAPAAPTGAGVDLVVFAPRNGLDAHAPDPEAGAPLVRAGVPHLYAGVLEDRGFVGPMFLPAHEGSGGGTGQPVGGRAEGSRAEGHGGGRAEAHERGPAEGPGTGRKDGSEEPGKGRTERPVGGRADGSGSGRACGGACAGCLALHRAEADPAWPRMLAQLRSGRPGPLPACDTALATTVAGLTAVHALMLLDGGTPASVGGRVEVSLSDTSFALRPVPRHPGCDCAAAPGYGCASVGNAPAAGDRARVTMVAG